MSNNIKIKILTNFKEAFDTARKTGNLWVINSSDSGGRQLRGDVALALKDPHTGQDIPVSLIATWLPTNLLSYSEVELFENSRLFREYCNKGLLSIISDETAQMLLKHPNAKAELARYNDMSEGMRNAINSSAASNSGGELDFSIGGGGGTSLKQDIATQETSAEDLNAGNTPQVQQLLQLANRTPADEIASLHDQLVGFYTRGSLIEAKAFAAGLDAVNSPIFQYSDAAFNAYAGGMAPTEDTFEHLRNYTHTAAPGQEMTFSTSS